MSFLSNLYSKNSNAWETTEFIWNFGIINSCDLGCPTEAPQEYFSKSKQKYPSPKTFEAVKPGSIIWLKCEFVQQFIQETLPEINSPFVLVISDGDDSFPSEAHLGTSIDTYLSNENIIHIFAQNCDYSGKSSKLSHLPIGVDYHSIAYSKKSYRGEKGSPSSQEAALKKILKELQPTYLRKKRAFVDFQLNDSMKKGKAKRYLQFGEDRTSIFKQILKSGLIDYGKPMSRSDLWKKKGQYAFSVSPHGNGLDCHRTWEDLILGCIVIVKTSPLDPLYEGLPVVIINDWSEITKENMELWLNLYGDAFSNPSYREKLTNAYWLHKIREKAAPYKTTTF